MNRDVYRLREKFPDPGADPVARLRHVVAVHEETNPDDMAVRALAGVYDHPTGLTYGDLKALLALVGQAPLTPTTLDLASEYRTARNAYFDLDPDANDGAELDEACGIYEQAAKVLAEQMLFEIGRADGSTRSATRTSCVIQMYSLLEDRWIDLEGQLTHGYSSVEQARVAFAAGWGPLKSGVGSDRFRIVERTVTETVFEAGGR